MLKVDGLLLRRFLGIRNALSLHKSVFLFLSALKPQYLHADRLWAYNGGCCFGPGLKVGMLSRCREAAKFQRCEWVTFLSRWKRRKVGERKVCFICAYNCIDGVQREEQDVRLVVALELQSPLPPSPPLLPSFARNPCERFILFKLWFEYPWSLACAYWGTVSTFYGIIDAVIFLTPVSI